MRTLFYYLKLPINLIRFLLAKRRNSCSSNCLFVNIHVKGTDNEITLSKDIPIAVLSRLSIKIRGNSNKIHIGKIHIADKGKASCVILGMNNTITLADNILVVESCLLRIAKHCHHGSIRIGNGTSLRNVIIRNFDRDSSTIIGNDCMFSYDVLITNTDEHLISSHGKVTNRATTLYIGDHVWISLGARIMKNSHISSNSIVGACSIVAGKFYDEHVVLAGNPARIVKHEISWSRAGTNDAPY